jgi:hypothetical protein
MAAADLVTHGGAPAGYNTPIEGWSVNSNDDCTATDTSQCLTGTWGTSQAIANNVTTNTAANALDTGPVQSGGIVLLHDTADAGTFTAPAIPLIVNAEAAKGLLPGNLASSTNPMAGPWVPLPPYYLTAVAPS